MKTRQQLFLSTVFCLISFSPLLAQDQGQPRQRFDPAQMVAAEKKAVYEKITDLSQDQKDVIEIIYSDYTKSFTEMRENANGDFQAMREKMMTIRKKKDDSMKEVLNEDQFKKYTELMEELRQRRRPRGNQ